MRDLNIDIKILNCLEGIQGKIQDLEVGNSFLNKITIAQEIVARINN